MQNYLLEALLQTPGYICWKNRDLLFMGGNLNFLKMAGFKSVEDLIGKTDYEMPWGRSHADQYRNDDRFVLKGQSKINYVETQIRANKKKMTVVVNKTPLYDQTGTLNGLICHYYELQNYFPSSISLTNKQSQCLSFISDGLSAKQIAKKMNLSPRTVESYTTILKDKFRCSNKAELIKKSLLINLAKKM